MTVCHAHRQPDCHPCLQAELDQLRAARPFGVRLADNPEADRWRHRAGQLAAEVDRLEARSRHLARIVRRLLPYATRGGLPAADARQAQRAQGDHAA